MANYSYLICCSPFDCDFNKIAIQPMVNKPQNLNTHHLHTQGGSCNTPIAQTIPKVARHLA